jgi:hypothetical protein
MNTQRCGAGWSSIPAGPFISRPLQARGELQSHHALPYRAHNADPKPFMWSKPADQIIAKLNHRHASVH